MIKYWFNIFLLFVSQTSFSQDFLNGSFELTISDKDTLNIPSLTYDILMPHSNSFGSVANIDILKSDAFCGTAQQGQWYIALTGGGTDKVSLKLSKLLIPGRNYRVSFYDRMCPEVAWTKFPIQIGVSKKPDEFGELLYTANNPSNEWSLRSFNFTALSSLQYITVRIKDGGSYGTWTQIDNFSMECTMSSALGNDTTLCEGDILNLQPIVPNAAFVWQDGSRTPNYIVTQAGQYAVQVSTADCSGSDTVVVSYQKCTGEVYIPNAFSPNGDGLNDFFRAPGFLQDFQMQIYNRSGVRLFVSVDMQAGWDGKANGISQPVGAYIYMIRYRDRTGTLKLAKGTITLTR